MAIVVVLAGTWLGYQKLADDGCSGQIKLNVAAATEIAPAVERAAQQWTTGGAQVNGTCVAVTVTGANSSTMASTIGQKHGATLTGLGAGGKDTVPDVWIADSTTWLLRLRSDASGFRPTDGKSVATSPVVVAMPVPVAQTVGWPDRKLGWNDLLKKMTTGNALRTGIVDPTRDAAGLAGLLALAAAAGTGGGVEAKAQQVGAMRALAAGSSSLREDLLQKFPRSADATDLATGISAAPLSEEDVVAYNADKPPVPLAALYLNPQPPSLDYPYLVMPGVDLTKAAAATGLREALEQPGFKNELAKVGLRAPDGTVGAGFAAPTGAPQATPGATAPSTGTEGSAASGIDASAINRVLGSWTAITLPGRVLAVFDVSGSMKTKVPTAGNLDRAAVTRAAAVQGLTLFDDKWEVGTWVFSTEMDGDKPYKEVVPITPLTSGRAKVQASVSEIVPKEGGNTGLYDTTLAAYKEMQENWVQGKVNSVLLFTDGKNENANGISRETLIAELKKIVKPEKPIRMVIIGIGTGVDADELEAITAATGGGVFVAPDPAKISEIFLEAISSRNGAR
ncbi:substrate-binding domain-containing protein [Couchioplanes caeruleus]|uniref:VWA domain-containing protein n=2 Tax=Couchioplanes caeruleus TaxID=56438 RepID=A0A1K0G441_9ACTN|nr:substrate-binding domain-containing protein [Couchioplanes caeruleus]OJF12058.1 VWA domain-containing protein [Couchioplanes caeruleus subsp. caeruleus]ROP29750.1 von Willebrand factor type A domain-containing protein [Couchioplanes caeruleus]